MMQVAFGELFGYLGKKGIKPAGIPFSIYFTDPKKVKPNENKWEVGVPVAAKVKDAGNFKYKEIPATTAVTLIFKGPFKHKYFQMAWNLVSKYVKDKKYNVSAPPMEFYLAMKGHMGAKINVTKIAIPIIKR